MATKSSVSRCFDDVDVALGAFDRSDIVGSVIFRWRYASNHAAAVVSRRGVIVIGPITFGVCVSLAKYMCIDSVCVCG